jgi:hypothetical protein
VIWGRDDDTLHDIRWVKGQTIVELKINIAMGGITSRTSYLVLIFFYIVENAAVARTYLFARTSLSDMVQIRSLSIE